MKYQKREKLKSFIGRFRLLDGVKICLKYLYRIRYFLRHKRCEREAKQRRSGKIDHRFLELKKFKNIHEGERCFIIATGPSLLLEDVEKLKNEYTISVNSITKLFNKTDWRPTYYGIQDPHVYDRLMNTDEFKSIKRKFVADWMLEEHEVTADSVLYPLDLLEHTYYKPPVFRTMFSDDAYIMVYDGNSITYSMLQIAVYMGFKTIYLLGCDCDYSGEKKHFAEYGFVSNSVPENDIITAYRIAKKYADEHGIKIYNATRGGKLEVFERVDFDTLF